MEILQEMCLLAIGSICCNSIAYKIFAFFFTPNQCPSDICKLKRDFNIKDSQIICIIVFNIHWSIFDNRWSETIDGKTLNDAVICAEKIFAVIVHTSSDGFRANFCDNI